MKRLGMVGMSIVTAMVSGCAAQPATGAASHCGLCTKRHQAISAPPPPTAAEILAAQPAEVREAVKEHDSKGKWPSYTDADAMCSIRTAKVRSR